MTLPECLSVVITKGHSTLLILLFAATFIFSPLLRHIFSFLCSSFPSQETEACAGDRSYAPMSPLYEREQAPAYTLRGDLVYRYSTFTETEGCVFS